MVQTAEGALRNPWIRHLKGCAQAYRAEKALPRRRLNRKSPEEDYRKKPSPPPAPPESKDRPQVAGAAQAPQGAPKPTISPEQALPLMKFVGVARKFLKGLEGERTTAARFARELASVGDLKEALKEAGLPTKTAVASFVKAFPEFKMEVPANGGTSYVGLR
jgi:hypothetical protein